MKRTAHRVVAALALVFGAGLPGCEDGSGLELISVTVEGTVVGQGQAPVEGVWVHLLAGPQSAPRAVTADETDMTGAYAISIEVDPADCNDLHLRVLETQTFDASVEPLNSSLLGSCGEFTGIDFIVDVAPPPPAASGQPHGLRLQHLEAFRSRVPQPVLDARR